MPYLVVCPNCGSKLKSGQPVPAGRSLNCPQCKAAFTLSEPAPEVDAQNLTPPAPKPAAPPAAPTRPAPPAPAPAPRPRVSDPDEIPAAEIVEDDRPQPRRRRDDEDDRPRSRRDRDGDSDDRPRSRRGRDEEHEDRPRSRRNRDEDDSDERPRSRRRVEDAEDEDLPRSRRDRDEEEDRPSSRRRQEDDDSDERPARRRRPADDEPEEERPRSRRVRDSDDDEERPRGRKGRAAVEDEPDEEEDRGRGRRRRGGKKKGKGMLIGLVAGAAALLLLGGGAVMYFVDPFGWFGGGGASSDMLAWMPADTQSVQGIDFDQVNKHPKALNSTRTEIRDAEAIGIKAEDVSSAMQAKKTSKNVNEVTVIKLKATADKDKISKAAGGQEATAIGKKYYKTNGGGALYFPSDKIVVITRSESTMTDLLANDGKVVISKDLQDVIKKADGHIWMAGIGTDASMFGGGDMGNMGKAGFPGMTPMPTPKTSVMNAKFTSDEVTIKVELTFSDADTAKRAKESIEGMMNMVKGFMDMAGGFAGKAGPGEQKKLQDAKKMFDSLKVTQSGSTVTITMTGPIDSMDGFGKGGGFGGR